MKFIRIVFNTGEVNEQGKPILLSYTLRVESSVNAPAAAQIAELIDSLTQYVVQEAYLVTTEQVI